MSTAADVETGCLWPESLSPTQYPLADLEQRFLRGWPGEPSCIPFCCDNTVLVNVVASFKAVKPFSVFRRYCVRVFMIVQQLWRVFLVSLPRFFMSPTQPLWFKIFVFVGLPPILFQGLFVFVVHLALYLAFSPLILLGMRYGCFACDCVGMDDATYEVEFPGRDWVRSGFVPRVDLRLDGITVTVTDRRVEGVRESAPWNTPEFAGLASRLDGTKPRARGDNTAYTSLHIGASELDALGVKRTVLRQAGCSKAGCGCLFTCGQYLADEQMETVLNIAFPVACALNGAEIERAGGSRHVW